MHQGAFLRVAVVIVLPLIVLGCSKGRPMGDVQGRVSINGQPLEQGSVRFIPINGDTATAGGDVRDGNFHVEVPVAKQRVEFSANVVDREKTPPNATAEQIVMKKLVPDRYNAHSELTLDVVSGVNRPPEFKLTNP